MDDAAHIAATFGPVCALWTGMIGFVVFYAALPACMMAWTLDRKAALKGSTAAAFTDLLDQVMWHRFILSLSMVGVAILLVCSVIAIW